MVDGVNCGLNYWIDMHRHFSRLIGIGIFALNPVSSNYYCYFFVFYMNANALCILEEAI